MREFEIMWPELGRSTGTVITAIGFAFASSTPKHVVNAFLGLGRSYDGCTGAVLWRRGFGAIHTALFDGKVSKTV